MTAPMGPNVTSRLTIASDAPRSWVDTALELAAIYAGDDIGQLKPDERAELVIPIEALARFHPIGIDGEDVGRASATLAGRLIAHGLEADIAHDWPAELAPSPTPTVTLDSSAAALHDGSAQVLHDASRDVDHDGSPAAIGTRQ